MAMPLMMALHLTQKNNDTNKNIFFFSLVALQPNVGHGLLILGVSRSHTMMHQSVGLLWTSDQLVAETST